VKQNFLLGVVLFAALVSCLIGWALVPWLQDAQRTVDAEAGVHLERARRLLDQFSYGLSQTSVLLGPLAEAGVDVDGEDIEGLVDAAGDAYQEKHAALWEAHQPSQYGDLRDPRPDRASYGNIERDIRNGIDGREELFAENDALLDEALAEVNLALAVTSGDANARNHVEANRLKGIVLLHQGLDNRLWAQRVRLAAGPYRKMLTEMGLHISSIPAADEMLAQSGIDDQVDLLQSRAAEAERHLAALSEGQRDLENTIEGLDLQLAAAVDRRNQARGTAEEIRRSGVDFSDPNGASLFETQLLDQDRIAREAEREVKAIEFGSLPNARIDDSGDFLAGQYVEGGSATDLTIEHGLGFYRSELSVLVTELEGSRRALDDLRGDIDRLEGIKNIYADESDRVRQLVQAERANAPDVYAELNRIESEAEAIEDDALDLFDQSIRASDVASRSARDWVTGARRDTSGMSSESKQRSAYAQRLDSEWMGGHITAQMADARLAKAWIYYIRYIDHKQTAALLGRVAAPLSLAEADPEADSEKAGEAHEKGLAEVAEAVQVLERAHRAAQDHWTFVAQQAGANYLLGLFGHPQYFSDALEGYRNVLKGREDKPFMASYAARTKKLENR